VIGTFGKDPKPEEVCTAGLPEAFLLLHQATGDERYLKFAAEIRHGNSKAEVQCASLMDWKRTFDSAAAHVYVMLARCYAQTELYRPKRSPSLLEMSAYMRHELLRAGGGLNVIGSASDGEWFSSSQNGAGMIGESCVTAHLERWLDSLMRLNGDLRYGDIMERTIYNALFDVRLRILRRCRNAAIRINDKDPVGISHGAYPYEIRCKWKAGDTMTLEMPMGWRFIKGHQLQEGKAALARGPVVHCLGTAQNEEILKRYPNFNGIVIDPASLGEPEPDPLGPSRRKKVTVKARVEAPGAWSKGAPHLTLTFTEFVDPTGIVTYVHLLDFTEAVEDELMDDCFGE